MLRSNWRVVLAIGLAALFAATVGFFIANDAIRLQGFYEHQADQHAQTYRDTAHKHAERACTGVVTAERYRCIHDQYHDARQREREEYDLQAQLVTSAWTRAMGLAAIIAMIVGIIGVGLIYTTFHETRQANELTKMNIRARVFANVVAIFQNPRSGDLNSFISLQVNREGLSEVYQVRCTYLKAHIAAFAERPDPTPYGDVELRDIVSNTMGGLSFAYHWPGYDLADDQIVTLPGTDIRVEFEITYVDCFGESQCLREAHAGKARPVEDIAGGGGIYPSVRAELHRVNVIGST